MDVLKCESLIEMEKAEEFNNKLNHDGVRCESLIEMEKSKEFNANRKKLNIMLHGVPGHLYSVSFNDDAKLIERNQKLLNLFDGENHCTCYILGSCDGLLLVLVRVMMHDHLMYIWNPATGEYKILPQLKPYVDLDLVCGFGRDLTTDNDNYKVLILETILAVSESQITEFEVNMYTTHTNSWKRILPNIPFRYSNCYPVGMVLANGSLHHLAEIDPPYDESLQDLHSEAIISFDLKDDKFRMLPMPPYCGTSVDLCALKGDLCYFCADKDFNVYFIWKMEKEHQCWTEMFSIDSRLVMDKPISIISVLHLFDDGQKILLTAHYAYPHEADSFVFCYHIEHKTASFLIQGSIMPYSIFCVPVVYEETPHLTSTVFASSVDKEPIWKYRRALVERAVRVAPPPTF